MSISPGQNLTAQQNPDAGILQRRASEPQNSVWVGASAGTGKTKVLTDRVLRLLLPRPDGQSGTPPHKILCLTFTKAGAGEMALRVSETLANWAVLGLPELSSQLSSLLGRNASPFEIETARKLFANVIDTPGGMKIMTIHSFCQSLLGRFPLEAGLTPNFQILEESDAREFLNQAIDQTVRAAKTETSSPLNLALNRLTKTVYEDHFTALVSSVISEREQFQSHMDRHFGPLGFYEHLCQTLQIAKTENPDDCIKEHLQDEFLDKTALLGAAKTLIDHGTDQYKEKGRALENWLRQDDETRFSSYAAYREIFLTGAGTMRSRLITKDAAMANPDAEPALKAEAERLLTLEEHANAARMALLTRDLFLICAAILDEYRALKSRVNGLDFDDLILHSLALLSGKSMKMNPQSSALWVQHKLDEGLDHILIDEAQDTNPEQWKIIKALCEDFFSGQGARDVERTIFTVGDEKQSIYSFQRASPVSFNEMQEYFASKVNQSGKIWDSVPMQKSFRSADAVLRLVDSTFAPASHAVGLGKDKVTHYAHREGQEGIAELWPLFETDKTEDINLWNYAKTSPGDMEDPQMGSIKCARHIATTIKAWLDNGEMLPSRNRSLQAGDILILVRTRSKLVNQISKALKDLGIPVSGLDRVVLNEQIAVQDLLCCAEFALQPNDDLNLACLLKTPFINIGEERLLALCAQRQDSPLWRQVQNHEPAVAKYLEELIEASRSASPFEFFSHILHKPCPAAPHSGRQAIVSRLGMDALEAIDVFMSQSLSYGTYDIASLQLFMQAQKRNATEIKREQDAAHSAVRIMTIHGSKGLEAPVVILADAATHRKSSPPRPGDRLLWPSQTSFAYPIWTPSASMEPPVYAQAKAMKDAALDEEYRRLLYVALTRAADRIYIAGSTGKRGKLSPDSWYSMILSAFQNMPGARQLPGGAWRYHTPQTSQPDKTPGPLAHAVQAGSLPDWAMRAPENLEERRASMLRPSRLDEYFASPLDGQDTYRFLRGQLAHKLLQHLPEISPPERRARARAYLETYGRDLPPAIREITADEILHILEHPDYAEIFGSGSQAEVPVSGRISNSQLVNGQIDRLLVTDKKIMIIDYKTNRPPPKSVQDIPLVYREQMRLYKEVLSKIYPGMPVHCYLLWTDGPNLMEIPENLLETATA